MERDRANQAEHLARRLRRLVRGQVLHDVAGLAAYAGETGPGMASDRPARVVLQAADEVDVEAGLGLAAELGVRVRARGAGTGARSAWPPPGHADEGRAEEGRAEERAGPAPEGRTRPPLLVIDASRHLVRPLAVDAQAGLAVIQPGIRLDAFQAWLRPLGLWWPLDLPGVPMASLGGLVATNAIGPRSLGFGTLRHRVEGLDVILGDGTREFFGPFGVGATRPMGSARTGRLVSRLFESAHREQAAIAAAAVDGHRPDGFAWDIFAPRSRRPYTSDGSVNLAHLLVGSQGGLAWFARLHLAVCPSPEARVSFRADCPGLAQAIALAKVLRAQDPWAVGFFPAPGRRAGVVLVAEFGGLPGPPKAGSRPFAARCDAVWRALAAGGATGIALVAEETAQDALWAEVCGASPRSRVIGRLLVPLGLEGGLVDLLAELRTTLAVAHREVVWAGHLGIDEWCLVALAPAASGPGGGLSERTPVWDEVGRRLSARLAARPGARPMAAARVRLAALDQELRQAFDPDARLAAGLRAPELPWSGFTAQTPPE